MGDGFGPFNFVRNVPQNLFYLSVKLRSKLLGVNFVCYNKQIYGNQCKIMDAIVEADEMDGM